MDSPSSAVGIAGVTVLAGGALIGFCLALRWAITSYGWAGLAGLLIVTGLVLIWLGIMLEPITTDHDLHRHNL